MANAKIEQLMREVQTAEAESKKSLFSRFVGAFGENIAGIGKTIGKAVQEAIPERSLVGAAVRGKITKPADIVTTVKKQFTTPLSKQEMFELAQADITGGLRSIGGRFIGKLIGRTKKPAQEALGLITRSGKQSISGISKEVEPLAQEARKFKSAEEFVNSQTKVFRGGEAIIPAKITESGISVSLGREPASRFGEVSESFLSQGTKILKFENIPQEFIRKDKIIGLTPKDGTGKQIVDYARRQGFDAIDLRKFGEGEIRVLNPNVLKTKSQLTDFYNQAVKGIEPAQEVIEFITQSGKQFAKKFPQEVGPIIRKGIKERAPQILEQRRGILSDTDIQRLAQGEIGVFEKVSSASPGTILPAEQNLKLRQDIADRVLRALSPEEVVETTKILPQALGVRAEAGRAVRSFRQPLRGAEEAAQRLLKMADELPPNVAEDIRKLARFITSSKEPTFLDKLVEAATAVKLTSPLTWFRNISGNTFAAILKYPDRFFTGMTDAVRATITGTRRERFVSEALSDFIGTFGGLKEGAKASLRALKDETFALGQRRIEEAVPTIGGAISGVKGKIIRIPFRVLTAQDAFFRVANERGALFAAAQRQALQEGLGGAQMIRRMNELIEAPTEALLAEAQNVGKKLVFQKDLTGFMKSLNGLRQRYPVARLIVPFFKTPVNIFKSIIEHTPLTFALPSTLKALKVGGGEASEVFGRMFTGSAILSGLTIYAMEGLITGRGPQNKAERDALYRQGWQPYSLRIGNNYFSYRGYEPLTGYLGLVSDIAESTKEPNEQQILKMLGAITGDLLDQPFLTGVEDVFKVLTEPETNASQVFANFIGGATIPTGISYFARLIDPVYRQPKGVLQTLESRLPFMSDRIMPLRNVFGQEARREGGVLQRLAPTVITTAKIDPVEAELARLNKTVGFPSKTAFGEKLTDGEYDTLLRVTGNITKDMLNDVFASQEYQSLPDVQKEKMVDRVVDKVRERVRERAFKEKELLREIKTRLRQRGHSAEQAEVIAPEVLTKILQGQ